MEEQKGAGQVLLFEVISDEQGDRVIILPLYRETEKHAEEIISIDVSLYSMKKGLILSFVQPCPDVTSMPGHKVLDICSEVPATLLVAMLSAQKNELMAKES